MHDVLAQINSPGLDRMYPVFEPVPADPFARGGKVLVISGGPQQFSLAVSRLQLAGCTVLFADDSGEGIELALSQRPDLIICELAMANIDGLELCRHVRRDERLSATPILLVGDLAEQSPIVKDSLRCGASDYVVKRIDQGDLFKRCSSLIGLKGTDGVFDENEEVFRTLIENISDIITIIAADGTIRFESPSIERILGYKPDELLGRQAFDLIHPEDVERLLQYFKTALHSFTTSPPIEYRFLAKDKSWRYIESIGKPFNDPQHGLVVVVTSRDITDRKTALDERDETDVRLQTIFDGAAIGMALVTWSGHAVQSNRALQKMIGYTADELKSMSFVEFTHPEDVEGDVALLKEIYDGKRSEYRIEKRYISKRGEVIWVRLTVSAIGRHAREARHVIAMIENINDQKFALEALSVSEERFRTQFNGLPIPTFTWRKEKGDFVFQGYNTAADKLTRGLLSKSIGMKASESFADKPLIIDAFNRCVDEKITVNHSGPYRFFSSGELKYLDANIVFIKPDIVMVACRDITEQTETERLLKESRERFELLSVATNDGLWDWDFATDKLWLNDEFYNLLGIREGEDNDLKGIWYSAIHEEDRERVINGVREAVQKGITYWVDEYRMTSRDGFEAIILDRGYLVYDDAGKPVRMIGAVMDITDLRQTETALLHQKQVYGALIDSIEGIVWEAGAYTLNCSFVSQKAERLLGYPTERWTTESNFWANHIHPEDRDRVMKFCAAAIAKRENHEIDYRMIGADGRVVWLHDVVTVDVTDSDDIRLRGVMVDITESKNAESALAEANERAISEYVTLLERLATLGQQLGAARELKAVFKAIVDFAVSSVPCSALIVSLYDEEKSVRDAIYVWYNGEESDISGLQGMRVGAGPAGQAIKSGEVLVLGDYLAATGQKPTHHHYGFEEDPRVPQSSVMAPMKMMGKVIGLLEVQSYELHSYTNEHATVMRMAANLTANAIENVRLFEAEQTRAEQLRQSQKLESVGRLAGGIAHDFNNMLTAINGFSDLTLRKLPKEDPLRGNIEEIKKAGERSAQLTQQLLAFSRQQVLRPKILDINRTVNDTAGMLKRLIGEDIELGLALADDLGSVQADPGQLAQVIINLAVNSRDAMPDGGKVTIETANKQLDESSSMGGEEVRPGSYVMLAVSDTGTGMSDEVLKHIFEPFFTTKSTGKGSGLGLATVYGIVKQSGGHITAYSEVGQGTAIKVYLPRVDAKAEEVQAENKTTQNIRGSETVLLVEDEDLVRRMTKKILESCGYTVIEASDGVEAMEICRQTDRKIDLLLTDVVMPKMSGRQLVQNVAGIRSELKVMFMSGYTDDSVVRHGVIESGENFIQKPFVFNALATKVREVLDQK